MIRKVVDCDRCNAKAPCQAESFQISVGRYTDAAGSMDNHVASFDLCGECTRKLSLESRSDIPKYIQELLTPTQWARILGDEFLSMSTAERLTWVRSQYWSNRSVLDTCPTE